MQKSGEPWRFHSPPHLKPSQWPCRGSKNRFWKKQKGCGDHCSTALQTIKTIHRQKGTAKKSMRPCPSFPILPMRSGTACPMFQLRTMSHRSHLCGAEFPCQFIASIISHSEHPFPFSIANSVDLSSMSRRGILYPALKQAHLKHGGVPFGFCGSLFVMELSWDISQKWRRSIPGQ